MCFTGAASRFEAGPLSSAGEPRIKQMRDKSNIAGQAYVFLFAEPDLSENRYALFGIMLRRVADARERALTGADPAPEHESKRRKQDDPDRPVAEAGIERLPDRSRQGSIQHALDPERQ